MAPAPEQPEADTRSDAAVVLLSGGVDSATCLAWAAARYARVVALSFDYAQRHRAELDAAHSLSTAFGAARHAVVRLDLREIGGSALTDDAIDVPDADENAATIPATYVPARNMTFLSVAFGLAEVENADAVVIGVNAVDYSGYPDCRPAFIEAFAAAARLGTRRGVEYDESTTDVRNVGDTMPPVRVETPLIGLRKADILRMGHDLGVDYSMTVSCYAATPEGLACGRCDSCRIRAKGFADAGLADPTRYAPGAPVPA